jgi:hypothetical protein
MSESLLIPVLVFTLFIVVFGIIVRVGITLAHKAQANVRTLAERLKLQFMETKPALGLFPRHPEAKGTIRGKSVRIYNYTSGSGKNKSTWSALAVTPAAHGGLTFGLMHEGFGSKLLGLFGSREVQVGNPAFDREWYIRTNAPEFFAAALLPEIQGKIQANPGSWNLKDGVIVYNERGLFSDAARCERFATVADTACDLADIAEVYARQAKS